MQRVLHRCVLLSIRQQVHHLKHHAVLTCNARTCHRTFAAGRRHTVVRLVRCLQTETGTPVNKEHGGTVMTDQLYGYLLSHTQEHEALNWLRKQTAIAFPVGARMQVSPEQAQFLAWLVKLTRSTKALELGVFTGYSALAVALALPPEGKLVACERDIRPLKLAQQAFEKAGVADKITIVEGPALASLERLLQQPDGPNTFDFAFIDADKRAYTEYYELCLQLVRPGGIIALDNVLWYGKVADPEITDKRTAALRHLNQQLLHDRRILLSMIPVGDGIALCLKQ